MYFLEIVFLLAVFALLISQISRRIPRRFSYVSCVVGIVAVSVILFFGQARWQMGPAYLLFLILSLSLLFRSRKQAVLRWIGAAFGAALLAISVVLSLGMPIITLPSPEGPYPVGTASITLVDESRNNERFGAPDEPRAVSIRYWYPGQLSESSRQSHPRTLWQDLYTGQEDLFTLLAGYLGGIHTHSHSEIALAADGESFPLVIFSHGMLGHPEQNTLLMEHLASNGYVIASVGHPYMAMRVNLSGERSVGADFNAFAAATSQRTDDYDDDVLTRLGNASGADERGRIWMAHFENSSGLNELMGVWVDDLRFVADAISVQEELNAMPEGFRMRVRMDGFALMGMSFGGSAVAEFCKSDSRCVAGLNLDGGAYGSRQREPLLIPYLALIGPHNEGLNTDFMSSSESDFFEALVGNTAHNDFMDAAVVSPILKWLGVNGEIDGRRMIEITNAISLAFLEAYVRGGPKFELNTSEYPELQLETNRPSM